MTEWFNALSVLSKVFFIIGVIAGVALIIQVILMCISPLSDLDIDGDGDIDVDLDSGISIFTVKSLTAFFAVGSWVGLLMCSFGDIHEAICILVAVVSGAAAMSVVVLVMRFMLKLQCDGAIVMENLIGKEATVYVSIPQNRDGRGKITLTAQGKFMELDAVTDCDERLKVDQTVVITAVENDCTVVEVKN